MSSVRQCANCGRRPAYPKQAYCGTTCANEAKQKSSSSKGVLTRIADAIFDDSPSNAPGSYGSARLVRDAGGRTGNAPSGSNRAQHSSTVARSSSRSLGEGADSLCDYCQVRPKKRAQDPATGHIIIFPHCGLTCRNLAAQVEPAEVKTCGYSQCRKPSRDNPFCSESHARKALQAKEYPACVFCKVLPANVPFEHCSRDCALKDAHEKERTIRALTLLSPTDQVANAIANRFQERWLDPTGKVMIPDIQAIYQIQLPKKYEVRFSAALDKGDKIGGATTKSAFFGGQCICDLTVDASELCNWKSCAICIVLRKGFDMVEFGQASHTGEYGAGIYAHTNPFMAHRHTVRKAAHVFRAIILCSVVLLDEPVSVDKRKYAAVIDRSGRVFCSSKDFIIPRQLIVYKDPPVLGA